MPGDRPNVIGAEALVEKRSAVDRRGALSIPLIAGLRLLPTRPVPHEDGHVTEIARIDWEGLDQPIVQVHMTTTLAGRVRAWGLHRRGTDRLFVASGLVKIVCYDGRRESATFGRINEFTLSDRNPGLVIVPVGLYHGWKNIGTSEAIIVNMPTIAYDYDRPDALDLPWDSAAAREIIPYTW